MPYDIIKDITVEVSTDCCRVDTEFLHNVLLSLPAGIYLELYERMSAIILNNNKGA
jgi:hypothetical protein